jgi:hypothetical protein
VLQLRYRVRVPEWMTDPGTNAWCAEGSHRFIDSGCVRSRMHDSLRLLRSLEKICALHGANRYLLFPERGI